MTPETQATLDRFEKAYFEVLAKEEELAQAKREFRVIADNDLPEAMDSEDLEYAVTESGLKIKLSDAVHTNITEKNREAAVAWLAKNGYSAILKHEFTIQFGVKEDEYAVAFQKMIATLIPAANLRVVADHTCGEIANSIREMIAEAFPGVTVEGKRTVHLKTLNSFVKKKLKAGEPLPNELFGTYVPKSAQVVKEKENV